MPAALAAAVYPLAAPVDRRSWRLIGLGGAIVVAVAGLALLRLPGDAALNTVWAEDGRVFLHDATTDGRFGAMFHTYNGYVHLAPRLVAAVVASFPMSAAAALFALLSALVVGGVALFVYVASRDHIPSRAVRLGLCASLVLVPTAWVESLDNVANLQWFLIAGAFWALLWRPQSWGGRAAQLVICLLAAASEPLAALLLPIALGRVLATRSLREHLPTLGLLAGLALQYVIGSVTPPAAVHPSATLLGRVYLLRVVVPAVAGDRGDRSLWVHTGWTATYLISLALLAVAVIWACLHRRRGAAWLIVAFVLPSVVLFTVPAYLRWDAGLGPQPGSSDHLGSAARYTIVPIFLLYGLIACVLGGRWGLPRLRMLRIGAVAATAVVAMVAWALNFSAAQNLRVDSPRWDRGVDAARQACRASSAPSTVAIDIAPPGWSVELPCRDLGG